MANRRQRLGRISDAVRSTASGLGRRASVQVRRRAIGVVLSNTLPLVYPAERVLNPQNLLDIVIAVYLAIPSEWRFVVHETVEEVVDVWLPDGPLKSALHDAFSATQFASEAFLSRADLTDQDIRNALWPTLEARFTHHNTHGGPMATHPPAPAAPPAPPAVHYIQKLTEIRLAERLIYARIAEFGEREARPFTDVHRGISGIAGLLRDAVMSAVNANTHEAMEKLLEHWGTPELTRLGGMTGTGADTHFTTTADQFLADPKVQTVIGNLIVDHFGRKGAPIPAGLSDRIDAFFDGQGVPASMRAPLRRLLQPGSVEGAVDNVENVVYPAVYWSLCVTYAFPVFVAALMLLGPVIAWSVWNVFANEYALAWQVFTAPELIWRGGGLLANAVFLYGTCLAFLVSAVFVWLPFRRRPEQPTEPNPAAVPPGMTLEEFRAQRQREFEVADDEWRQDYRQAIITKIAAAAWSIAAIPLFVAVGGLVAMTWQFQWLTVVVTVIIPVIAGHLLWPADDFANLLRRTENPDTTHAAPDHAHPVVSKATRVHRITGTVMIILMAGPLLHAVAVLLAPQFWALATLCIAAIMIGLGPIIVSRIVAGTSEDAPHDVQSDAAKQRRWMLKRLPQLLGFGGLVGVYGTSLFFAVLYSGYEWWKACEGFEHTPECTVIHGGYADYVDSEARWEALRDRSAKALTKRKKPAGDACTLATQTVEKIEADYRTTILSAGYDVPDDDGACESLASDAELRKQFPDWSKACATQRVACKTKG